MTRQTILVVVLACSLGIGLAGCGADPADVGPPADLIFFGSNIVTMDRDQPTVDAVAVHDTRPGAASEKIPPADHLQADTDALLQIAGGICQLSSDMRDTTWNGRPSCNLTAPYRILTLGNSHEMHGYILFRNMLDAFVEANALQLIFSRTHGPGTVTQHCSLVVM